MYDNRSIQVKIIKENEKAVVVRLVSVNRTMPIPRKEFEKRVENGMYEIIGGAENASN